MDVLTTPSLETPEVEGPETHCTTLEEMYDIFLGSITDDMYMELTKEDTEGMLDEILMKALPNFEFPRKNIFDINWSERHFNVQLTAEEENIICMYMIAEWVSYQLASVELVRQKYSSSDVSLTSQESHRARLISLKTNYRDVGFHYQRLYCRRRVNENGEVVPTMDMIMGDENNASRMHHRGR